MPQFHFKALGIRGKKNPDEKVNIRPVPQRKKTVLGGRGYSPIHE